MAANTFHFVRSWMSPAKVRSSKKREPICYLIEALELFIAVADTSEIKNRLKWEVFAISLEVAVGQVASFRKYGVIPSSRNP